MKKSNSKPIKLTALFAAAFLTFSMAGLFAPAEALAAKAEDKQAAAVGYVNRQQVFSSYPGIQDLMQQIQSLRQAAQKDYDDRGKDLPEAERKNLNDTIAREEAQKEDALMKPVGDKIGAAIKAVAEEKELSVVLDATGIAYGGTDITGDVVAKIKQ